MLFDNMNIDTFSYVALPIMIFFARICDVTLGTLRVIFVAHGHKYIAPFLGFFEVFIWIIVISELLNSANNMVCYAAYAGGYAMGNFVGMLVEERIAIGTVFMRIFATKGGQELADIFRSNGFGATLTHAEGSEGNVDILQVVAARKFGSEVQKILNEFNPDIFYVVEDVRSVRKGIFPKKKSIINYRRPGK
ncbi:MAG: DUF2179 domain-containing protein [Prevotellaceae bacterium]|jgi:uncharacterized protein YebE (UPF0316 family)|nr:DUF2179 domain-containing protein [Prevotellaceae bacterium]